MRKLYRNRSRGQMLLELSKKGMKPKKEYYVTASSVFQAVKNDMPMHPSNMSTSRPSKKFAEQQSVTIAASNPDTSTTCLSDITNSERHDDQYVMASNSSEEAADTKPMPSYNQKAVSISACNPSATSISSLPEITNVEGHDDTNQMISEKLEEISNIFDIPLPDISMPDANKSVFWSGETAEDLDITFFEILPPQSMQLVGTPSEEINVINEQSENLLELPIAQYMEVKTSENKENDRQSVQKQVEGDENSVETVEGHVSREEQCDLETEELMPKKKRIRLSNDRTNRDRDKHPLTETCGGVIGACKKKCVDKISQERREEIWKSYWDLSYNERKAWLFHTIDRVETVTKGAHLSRRNLTFAYKLKDNSGVSHTVCKVFFLTTLGYNRKNDKAITTALNCPMETVTPDKDKRGCHQPANKINKSDISHHIESYHPCVSHYRREHAPYRRYLPSDVTIMAMHKDFKNKNQEMKCSYDLYRKEIRQKKISFTKLGEEECEMCIEFEINKQGHGHDVNKDELQQTDITTIECNECRSWLTHIRSAQLSRIHYQLDQVEIPEDTRIRSVDLQKVIMLPRMPGIKTVVFTKRIIGFHETFASVGKKTQEKTKPNNISILWHEAIAGRKAEEIATAFVKAMQHERDMKHLIFWLDNCAAQNKNWCLFSTLVYYVNNIEISGTECVTLKFFERGHTFMSADSVHHGVEKAMANRCIYDFADFVNTVAKSNSGYMDVIQLMPEDFLDWNSGLSIAKHRKFKARLADMAEVQVKRGSKLLYYKVSHEDTEFTSLDFLKKTFLFEEPDILRPGFRGISQAKKSDIVGKLVPLMPENRRSFWVNLAVNESSDDLLENQD